MAPTTHEQVASALARDYVTGNVATRAAIAITCEEHGILAALVILALPEPLRSGFVLAMMVAVAR